MPLFKKNCNVVFIGNYLPRICGIATFTTDLFTSVARRLSSRSNVYAIAVNDEGSSYEYPPEVIFSINQGRQKDYLEAANLINTSNAQVACLQHEFGIFGGEDGKFILSLISRLTIPLVTTLHTVLEHPSPGQKRIMSEIINRSSKLIVMSRKGAEILKKVYGLPDDKIELIWHGTPDFSLVDSSRHKKRFKLESKKMILTFGLLAPSKGIETVIRALPLLIKDFPDITYVVLGPTHPLIRREHGEKYRESLIKLVEKLKLGPYVIFDDRFVTLQELFAWLLACDIYVTPYLNQAQIVSGTLSYAIAAGNAIISTPYWYAEEMLAGGRGHLFDFNDSAKLAEILESLLRDKKKLRALQRRAHRFGRQMIWPRVSGHYVEILAEAALNQKKVFSRYSKSTSIMRLPSFDLAHIRRLTDDTGIIQHAKYTIPDRGTGYCIDDNARALILSVWAIFLLKDESARQLLPVYCSFVRYMQRDNGRFANFLDYQRNFLEEEGSDDSNGRTVWSLGFLTWRTKSEYHRSFAAEVLRKSYPMIPRLNLRGQAFAALGLVCYLRGCGPDDQALALLKDISRHLVEAYRHHARDQWHWFEDILCYDNAAIPMALFNAYTILKDDQLLQIAKESLSFLESVTVKDGVVTAVGNSGWYRRGAARAQFDQQAIDVTALVLAWQSAYRVTHDTEYLKKMKTAFDWFLGENDLASVLYDFESKGCSDGLTQNGPSLNQGAESTISFLLALLAMMEENEIENLD